MFDHIGIEEKTVDENETVLNQNRILSDNDFQSKLNNQFSTLTCANCEKTAALAQSCPNGCFYCGSCHKDGIVSCINCEDGKLTKLDYDMFTEADKIRFRIISLEKKMDEDQKDMFFIK